MRGIARYVTITERNGSYGSNGRSQADARELFFFLGDSSGIGGAGVASSESDAGAAARSAASLAGAKGLFERLREER